MANVNAWTASVNFPSRIRRRPSLRWRSNSPGVGFADFLASIWLLTLARTSTRLVS